MDLKSVADLLVAGCRTGREAEHLKEIYAANATSAEAFETGETPRVVTGIEAIQGKHEWWAANFEEHSVEVSDPMLHGADRFAVIFRMDATEKASGQRFQMEEIALYTVADGKIVAEEFFYAPQGA